MFLSTLF